MIKKFLKLEEYGWNSNFIYAEYEYGVRPFRILLFSNNVHSDIKFQQVLC